MPAAETIRWVGMAACAEFWIHSPGEPSYGQSADGGLWSWVIAR